MRFFAAVLLFALLTPAAFARKKVRDWTFLIYLNGKNNLDEYGKMNIKQMEKLGKALVQLNKDDRAKVVDVIQNTQSFFQADYGDLIDFLTRLKAATVAGLDTKLVDGGVPKVMEI